MPGHRILTPTFADACALPMQNIPHVLTFAAMLFVASSVSGVVEGFLTAGVDITAYRGLALALGYLLSLVVAMLVFCCMTLRRSADAFPLAALALLAEQLMGLGVTLLLTLVLAWPSPGAEDLALAAVGLAVKSAGMLLGVAWGLYAQRNR